MSASPASTLWILGLQVCRQAWFRWDGRKGWESTLPTEMFPRLGHWRPKPYRTYLTQEGLGWSLGAPLLLLSRRALGLP